MKAHIPKETLLQLNKIKTRFGYTETSEAMREMAKLSDIGLKIQDIDRGLLRFPKRRK